MAVPSSSRLLQLALPLVTTHGFTRESLARSVLALPSSIPHTAPLSDSAVTALFGRGDCARRTLIDAWLDEGLAEMGVGAGAARAHGSGTGGDASVGEERRPSVRDVLRARLAYNEPVLVHLPDAFALMAWSGWHVVDPLPAMAHAGRIADRACYAAGEKSLQLEWYTRRASLAAVYAAAELHQLTSPHTAYAFLDSLLESSANIKSAVGEVGLYSDYIFKSWKGIIKSSGILPL